MSFDLQSITADCQSMPPRIIVLGVEKIGKSTFAASSDRPVFFPVVREEGIDDLAVSSFPTVHSVDQLMTGLASLYNGEHDFGTVVVDSSSALEPVIWRSVCEKFNCDNIEKVGGGYGKGYTYAVDQWDLMLQGLDALRTKGMASIIIGHVKVKVFNDPEGPSYDQYQWDIHDKAANKLFRWADSILFCNQKVAVVKEDAGFGKTIGKGVDVSGGQRYLYTQRRPAHPGGGRGAYGRLSYELPLSWEAYVQAIASVVQP